MVLLYQSIDKLYENTVTAAKTSGLGQDGSGGGGFCEWISMPFLTSLDSTTTAINIGTSCMNIICVCVLYTSTFEYYMPYTTLRHEQYSYIICHIYATYTLIQAPAVPAVPPASYPWAISPIRGPITAYTTHTATMM